MTPAYLECDESIQLFIQGARKASVISIDTEATLLELRDGRGFAMGLSISYRLPGYGIVSNYFPFRHRNGPNLGKQILAQLKNLIESAPLVVFHHAKFDIVSLATLGIVVKGKFYCTMLMAHMIDENRPFQGKTLDALTKFYLNDEGKKKSEEFTGGIKFFGWEGMPSFLMHEYASYDSELTLKLYEFLLHQWHLQELEPLWATEMAMVRLLIKMEARGVRIDQELVADELDRGQKRMSEISTQLGFNPASPKDLESLLIETLGLPVVKRTPKGKASFDKTAMKEYEAMLAYSNDDRASLILEFRGYQKTLSSNYKPYLELLSPDGRLRPNYMMHRTNTSRLSCEKPALQQIPIKSDKPWNGNLKQAFIAADGFRLWEADYSQLELRLAAAYAKEAEIIEIFKSDRDVFQEMSHEIGMTRYDTKHLVYALQYGSGARHLSNIFRIDLNKAHEIRNRFYVRYPGFRTMANRAANKIQVQGFIRLWSQRRCHFIDPENEGYKAWAHLIQGGGAEIVKSTMLRLEQTVDCDDCRMLLQVHDSIVWEIREGMEDHFLPLIKKEMEAVVPDFGVPFKCSIHPWGE